MNPTGFTVEAIDEDGIAWGWLLPDRTVTPAQWEAATFPTRTAAQAAARRSRRVGRTRIRATA